MLVASSFDLWQKDEFFSAAEEVQASADIMESIYRSWITHRREKSTSKDFDELCRELQTSLATAKWQLDEFQRAVRTSSYRNEITTKRRKEFVSAIENRISHVEKALREYFDDEVKKPLRWVNLDEEEREKLAMFLSGDPRKSNSTKVKDSIKRENPKSCKDFVNGDVNRRRVVESDDSDPASGVGDLKITIDHDSEEKKPLMLNIESNEKVKGQTWKSRFGVYSINQVFRRVGGSQRHLQQTSINLQRGCSFRLTLVLMLTIFFLVPFVMYSN